jgi:hypothetical protein
VRVILVSPPSDDVGAALHLRREAADADTYCKPEPVPAVRMGGMGKHLEPELAVGSIRRLLEVERYADSAWAAAQQLAGLPGVADIESSSQA